MSSFINITLVCFYYNSIIAHHYHYDPFHHYYIFETMQLPFHTELRFAFSSQGR